MYAITTSRTRSHKWCLIGFFIAVCMLACTRAAVAQGGIHLTITKSNDAPVPVPSGQVFTYTLVYSWSGGAPGTLLITDVLPPSLDYISASPGAPISFPPVGPAASVTFTISATAPSGGGLVNINVRFRPGVTCPGERACNVATIMVKGDPNSQVASNSDCVIATATNKWLFWKDYISGCMLDSVITYRINLVNPSGGDIGGLNLTNATLADLVPPGAILTGVSGNWTFYSPGSGTGTVTLLPGPTAVFPVAAGWTWYVAYVTIKYPSGSFTAGQLVTNNARLTFQTPCSDGQFLTMNASASNTLCDHQIGDGAIYKWLNLWPAFPLSSWWTPTWSPGCCGTYYVYYQNTGALPQSSIVIDDNVPTTVDVGNVMTFEPLSMSSVTLEVFCCTGSGCLAAPSATILYTSPGGWLTYSPAGLPGPICRLRWTYTGTLAPGAYLYNSIDACVRSNDCATGAPVLAGDHIINTACVTGTNVPVVPCATSDQPVTPTAPNILTAKFFEGTSGACTTTSCGPSTAGPFYPGDIVRWRLVIANVGSAAATPCTITDALPTGFIYYGNPTYSYGPVYWAGLNNPPCCSLSATPPTAIIGPLIPPLFGATAPAWTFGTLPSDCAGTVNCLVIEFDTKVGDSPTVPPGSYFNTFTFSAGNLPLPVTSNPAEVTINGYSKFEVFKDVRPYITGSTFGPGASVQPGNDAEYRLRIKNDGILTLTDLTLLDILPHYPPLPADISVLPPYGARGSVFNLPMDVAASSVTPGYTYSYSNSSNPLRSPYFCTTADPPLSSAAIFGAFSSLQYGSFLIQGPGLFIAPSSTLEFTYRGTVPATAAFGALACNSFGVQMRPYGTTVCLKAESTPACVTVIPPSKSQCDSIWGTGQTATAGGGTIPASPNDVCCSFNTTVLNTLGNVVELDYHVLPVGGGVAPSGVVQSIVTSPCTPSSTIPLGGAFAGTTSGSLFFGPPCGAPLHVVVAASSTTASGQVCIELVATLVQNNGENRIQCRDTFCIQCEPAPKIRCDSMSVQPYLNTTLSSRSFTIYNLKAPVSPICSVKIAVTPPPVGGVTGSNLTVDASPHAWLSGPPTYTQITTIDGLPATSTVGFVLSVPYASWMGTVTVTVYHCDGDSCIMTYTWDPTKKSTITDIGTQVNVPDPSSLHMHALSFSREVAAGRHVRSIAVYYGDPATEIVAVTGATYPCDVGGNAPANCNDIFEDLRVKDLSMMVTLRRDLDDPANQADPTLVVVYRTAEGGTPSVDIVYYDDNGQEVGHERVDIGNNGPPGRAVSGAGGADRMAMVMGALTAHPNPTTGHVDVGFTLGSAATVDLELVDVRGTTVATVITGERFNAGEHHRVLEMGTIPSGVYLVTLRVNGVPSVLRLDLAK